MLRLLAFASLFFPLMALAQPACYPAPADSASRWGGIVRHEHGVGWYLYCWDGTQWLGNLRVMHRTDIVRAPIDVAGRSRQFAATPPSGWPALFAEWDKDTTGDCKAQIANAGYASILCLSTRNAMLANAPTAAPQAPPPPPPPRPPTEVWKVAPNSTYPTRPTYAWANGVRSTTVAAERVPVGSDCNPAIGSGDYRGVLGRTDRVALCRKQ